MSIGIEKKWPAVAPQLFSADGTDSGIVTVADARGFKVKQMVVIIGTALPTLRVQIKRFLSPTEFMVGPEIPPPGQSALTLKSDLTLYTVAATSFVYAEEQDKRIPKTDDIDRAVYEQEPANAIRVMQVNQFGQAADTVVGADGLIRQAVDAEVNVEVNNVALFTKPYDAIVPTYPSSTQELYQSKVGGIAGTNVQLVTINYTDATKNFIFNAFRIDN